MAVKCPKCARFLPADGVCTNCAGKSTNSPTPNAQTTPSFLDTEAGVCRIEEIIGRIVAENLKPLQSTLQDLNKTVTSLVTQVQKYEQEAASLKKENTILRQDNEKLEKRLDAMEQYTRRNNVVLHGIPVTSKEVTDDIVIQYAKAVGLSMAYTDIDVSHRLPKRDPNNTNPPTIIAKLTRRSMKYRLMSLSKDKKNVPLQNLGFQSNKSCYITDHLTQKNALLLQKVKNIAADNQWKYVWSKEGKILARRSVNDPVVHIQTETEAHQLLTSSNAESPKIPPETGVKKDAGNIEGAVRSMDANLHSSGPSQDSS